MKEINAVRRNYDVLAERNKVEFLQTGMTFCGAVNQAIRLLAAGWSVRVKAGKGDLTKWSLW